MKTVFKVCTVCAHHWNELADLIRDENLFVNGYQAAFSDSGEGLFFLTHTTDECGTTIAIQAGQLRDLYEGPEHFASMAHSAECDGHCLDTADLAPCKNPCVMRWARDVLQILKQHGSEELLKKLDQLQASEAA